MYQLTAVVFHLQQLLIFPRLVVRGFLTEAYTSTFGGAVVAEIGQKLDEK